jgi:RNA-directed DNA polymerase
MSDGGARHQTSAQAERSSRAPGEAGRGDGSGEARLAGQAERDSGRAQLLWQALTRENLVLAWKRVKANAGSAGSDGLSVRQTAEYLAAHWPEVREQLLNVVTGRGRYAGCRSPSLMAECESLGFRR